jgi:hypothetical protein
MLGPYNSLGCWLRERSFKIRVVGIAIAVLGVWECNAFRDVEGAIA